ncbi:Inactive protein RESTRICTED TEV MOVEMENT 2 [Euphorbia peplus]|nr:Inactive protein RESTRICTED TEV MOVEMENT 2 [Euphorbia peplus]
MATATRTIAIQYEDFSPSFQWKEEQASNLLLIHLPEFQKEEMKITYVHSSGIIRVTGEHPISNNKWRRFNKAFPVPENCNVQKIQAKFQSPTLTITLPKITPSSSSLIPNQEKPLSTTQKPADTTDHAHTKKQENQEYKQTDIGNDKVKKQDQENLILPPQVTQPSKKQDQENPIPQIIQPSKKQDQLNPIPQMTLPRKDQDKLNPIPPQITTQPPSKGDQDEKNKNKKKEDEEENNRKKRKEKWEDEEEISKKLRKEEKLGSLELKEINYGEKAKQVKKRIMEFGREISEDKQSLVNIGVAVLVIAALGAYIYASSKD